MRKIGGLGCLGCGGMLALLAILFVVGSVIGSLPKGTPTAASTPTAAPVKPDARVGSTRDIWIAAYGQPRTGQGILGERFGTDLDVVRWMEGVDGQQRAAHVEMVLPRERPVAEARGAASSLLPPDAVAVQTYMAPAGQTVEVFHSPQLASLFPREAFGDEPPGTFIQIAERGMPTTARVVIALGNRP